MYNTLMGKESKEFGFWRSDHLATYILYALLKSTFSIPDGIISGWQKKMLGTVVQFVIKCSKFGIDINNYFYSKSVWILSIAVHDPHRGIYAAPTQFTLVFFIDVASIVAIL